MQIWRLECLAGVAVFLGTPAFAPYLQVDALVGGLDQEMAHQLLRSRALALCLSSSVAAAAASEMVGMNLDRQSVSPKPQKESNGPQLCRGACMVENGGLWPEEQATAALPGKRVAVADEKGAGRFVPQNVDGLFARDAGLVPQAREVLDKHRVLLVLHHGDLLGRLLLVHRVEAGAPTVAHAKVAGGRGAATHVGVGAVVGGSTLAGAVEAVGAGAGALEGSAARERAPALVLVLGWKG